MRPSRLLAARFALRELRSGVKGFRVFLLCLALGVAALAASGSTEAAFRRGLAAQSRSILGGDLSVSLLGRLFTPADRALLGSLGHATDMLSLRAMASGSNGQRRLAELRGVDEHFPLAGHVTLAGAPDLGRALATTADGVPAAAVDPALLDRLGLQLGQTFRLGRERFVARARLVAEPDALSRGFALGPAVLVRRDVLARSGLIENDALFGETVRIVLRPGETLEGATRALAPLEAVGARVRTREDAAAGLKRIIGQVGYFLGFIGLASLLAGGLGVSTAVTAYLETRRSSIAILKALGAPGATVRSIYLLQIGALAGLGISIGLAAGAACPLLLGATTGKLLPIPLAYAVYPGKLLEAALFGLMAAASFSLGPIARARATSPAALFRRLEAPGAFGAERVAQALASLGLVGLTVATAPTLPVAAASIGAVTAAFSSLVLVGRGATGLARRARGLARGALRLGLANLGGPSSAAPIATPAIGLGVGLITSLLLLQASLLAEIEQAAPRAAPSLVLTEIAPEDAGTLDRLLATVMGPLSPANYRRTPFATGRIMRVSGRAVAAARIAPNERWAFDQDIGLTTIGPAPPDADLVAGGWWTADYDGPPEAILDAGIARAARVGVGGTITVEILGRTLDTRVAALRHVEFARFGASFPVILDPAALKGANLRQVALLRTTPGEEATIVRRVGEALPDVNVIGVREQLEKIAAVFRQLSAAIRIAASVTALTGLLVLIGAIASTSQARAREAAILKVLGASRRQILSAYGLEYGLVGLLAATTGAALGALCAWSVTGALLHSPWRADAGELALLLVGCVLLCAAAGLAGAAVAIARRPSPILRGE